MTYDAWKTRSPDDDLYQDFPHDDQERYEDYDICEACEGFGTIEVSRPQWDDPHYSVYLKCEECDGCGRVLR